MLLDIQSNKRKTAFIVSVFILFVTLIIYFICHAFDMGQFAFIFALSISIISAWASYYNSDKIILSISHARPATKEEDLKLVNILDALTLTTGLPNKPRLYVIDDNQPNAFATGRNPEHAIICVTTGLLSKLDYYELEGVVAHELAHIKNYDILLSAVITVMVGFVVMLSDIIIRRLFWGGRNSKKDSKGSGVIILIGLVCLILAPIFSKLMQFAISRRREYLADSTATSFTRNPEGLISALSKLDSDSSELSVVNSSTAHLYIVNPFKNKKIKKSSLFSTHPPIQDRIAALKNIK